MDAERPKNMGIKMVVGPTLDNDLIGFDPLYFDHEPEKDKGRTRLLRKWDPLTRGDLLLESLITGIYHYTL